MPKEMFSRPGDVYDIQFSINGEKHTVFNKYLATTSLNDYIRDVAGLKGTKVMCKEAGCGCCAVTVTSTTRANEKLETKSINSCTCPLYAVDGWQITTTEGIGNHIKGYHPIQDRVAKHNATQCGYCTPGFVMSMYGLLHQNPKPTQQEIEDSLDGHICRCTGYRSILDAMKSFGTDNALPGAKCVDIEDLNKHLCPKTGELCKGNQNGSVCHPPSALNLDLRESRWFRPLSLKELGTILVQAKGKSVRLVFGNTSTGIFKHEGPYEVYIDLHGVTELYEFKAAADHVIFGANTTLTKLKDHMKELQYKPGFFYASRVIKHLKVLASVLVRNAGCIAGNLMIKHGHPEFPSDLFTMMEAIGGSVHIFDSATGKVTKHLLLDFLRNVKMTGKVIVALEIPKFNSVDTFRSFKITPRWQNAHAYVNAAFKIPVDKLKVTGKPNFVIGGISAATVHATKAEEYLNGKTLSDAVIKETLKIMASELKPTTDNPLIASAKYRSDLAVNLLYKTLLEVSRPADPKIKSGADSMDRPLSSGLQTFQEKQAEFPLKQALPKFEAPLQAAGETIYTNDIPVFSNELFASFVLSTVGVGTIANVDPAEALTIPGVVKYLDHKDIPEGGKNDFMSLPIMPMVQPEEVFASEKVEYAGQVIGLILAETQELAELGARKVKVEYSNIQEPLVYLNDAIAKGSIHEPPPDEKIVGNPDDAWKEAEMTIEGEITEGTQYYFYIENQSLWLVSHLLPNIQLSSKDQLRDLTHFTGSLQSFASACCITFGTVSVAVPGEDGIDLYAATQWMDQNQRVAARVLNKPLNYINGIAPRVGGAFGGKFLYTGNISAAVSLAAYLTRRPVRLSLPMSDNMRMAGKRFPVLAKYRAGFNKDGKMKVIDVEIFVDSGFKPTIMHSELPHMLDQGYHVPNWRIRSVLVKTNKATNQACRGPGSVPAALIMESIMEHAAKELKMHPINFKEINLYEEGQTDFSDIPLNNCTLRDLWKRLKQTAQVEERQKAVEAFNKDNQWRKRGITMTAVKYGMQYFPLGHSAHVSIFAGDGTVTVLTSGIEMGQGLYSKMTQAVAATLRVSPDCVKVRANQNNILPNPTATGGSTGSELCVAAAIDACNKINERLAPLREKMPDAPWPAILMMAHASSIQLAASAQNVKPNSAHQYFTYCAGVVETEVDILTGEFQVRRVDIMCDFGESINPTIDIGQVEGAFVMGLGAFLTENLHYDRRTGEVLNDGTWEYKPPTTKDIPIDWRIHFLPDRPNPTGVLSSKAVGEPPIGLAVGALLAIKNSVEVAREELTGEKVFIPVEAPFTVEKVQQSTNTTLANLTVGKLSA